MLIRVIAISILFLGIADYGWAQDSMETLEQIIKHQVEYMSQIQSLDYEFAVNRSAGANVPGHLLEMMDLAGPRTSRNRMRYQGKMWRGDLNILDGVSETAEAYDGSKYQMLSAPDGGTLSVQEESPVGGAYSEPPPTLRSFGFVFHEVNQNGYEVLKDEVVWRQRFDEGNAKIVGTTTLKNGQDCVVMDIDLLIEPSGRFQRVYFAREKDYFPVQVEVRTGDDELVSVYNVPEFTEVRTESGTVRLPTELTLQSWNDEGHPLLTAAWKIDEETLRVNESLDVSTFTLKPKPPYHYWDRDNPENSFSVSSPDYVAQDTLNQAADALNETSPQTTTKVQATTPIEETHTKQTHQLENSNRGWFAVLGVCLLALALGLLSWSFRSKKKNQTIG